MAQDATDRPTVTPEEFETAQKVLEVARERSQFNMLEALFDDANAYLDQIERQITEDE